MGSELGLSDEKLQALAEHATSPLFEERERTALAYADAMTITGLDVSDELFGRLQTFFTEDAIIELTTVIAFENSSSKFNRALRVPSQGLWKRSTRIPAHE